MIDQFKWIVAEFFKFFQHCGIFLILEIGEKYIVRYKCFESTRLNDAWQDWHAVRPENGGIVKFILLDMRFLRREIYPNLLFDLGLRVDIGGYSILLRIALRSKLV